MQNQFLPAGCPESSAAGIVFTHELRCYFFSFLPIADKLLTESKNQWAVK